MSKKRLPESQIPDAHYAAMGRVADTWADLEFAIDHAIWKLLRTPQAFGACVTSQMVSIHPRTKALMSLLSLYDVSDVLVKNLSSVLGTAAGLSEIRNRLIHDKRMIRHPSDEVVRFEVSARSNLIFADKTETVDELNEFILKVGDIVIAFDDAWEPLESELQTSGGKLRGKLPQLARLPRGLGRVRPAESKTPPAPPEPSSE